MVICLNTKSSITVQEIVQEVFLKLWINSVLQDASYVDTAEINAGTLVDEAVDLLPPQQKKVYKPATVVFFLFLSL